MDNSPFSGSAAMRDGLLTRAQLQRDHVRIYRDVYIRRGVEIDAVTRARAAWTFAGGKATVAGLSAAALHGAKWIADEHKAELVWPEHRQPYSAIVFRADVLRLDETEVIDGVRVTTPARTAFDLGRRGRFASALETVDALCNATSLSPGAVALLAEDHRGSRGIVQMRQVLDIADAGAESPQESRTRLLISNAGLPRPQTQIQVRDTAGKVFARVDIGWNKWKVGVEYDGEHHWFDESQRAWDIERTQRLEHLGWRIVRISAQLLRTGGITVISWIRDALRAAGAPLWPTRTPYLEVTSKNMPCSPPNFARGGKGQCAKWREPVR